MRRDGFLAVNERSAVTYQCVSRVLDWAKKFGVN